MTLWTALRLRWHARRAIHHLKALEKAAGVPMVPVWLKRGL